MLPPQNLLILRYFVHIIGLINFTIRPIFQYLRHSVIFNLAAKIGFFGFWAQNISRNPHRHKDSLLFQQSLCMKQLKKMIQCLRSCKRGQKPWFKFAKITTNIQILRLKIPLRQHRYNVLCFNLLIWAGNIEISQPCISGRPHRGVNFLC